MTDLNLFRFSISMSVRYRDVDMQQHVNNAVYFTYMETARIAYMQEVVGWDGDPMSINMIVARAEVDYRAPLALGDRVQVHVRTARIGGKSFDFLYAITRTIEGTPQVAAEGKTVQVAYDYKNDRSIPVPEAWRERLVAFEPGLEG